MNSLIPYLTKLSDSRQSKGIRHQQTPTLVIMIMSLMCGYTSFKEQNFVSLVSFFRHQSHLVLRFGSLENSKQSEIHQVQALLSLFKVEKAIFTLDALHTQKKQ